MDISLTSIKKTFSRLLRRFHVVIFVVTILGSLAIVILLLNKIIVTSTDSAGYTSDTNNTAFDQATIDRIKQLKTTDQSSGQLDFSQGRTNPFVE